MKVKISEFTSYIYIKNELEEIGWNAKNPARNVDGQVYTQQECLNNENINRRLKNLKPEYVVKINEDTFYIIEAKSTIDEIDKAFQEAIDYAELINKDDLISAPIISGVAGNDEDGYIVRSAFLENGQFQIINYHGKEITSLVSFNLAQELIDSKTATIKGSCQVIVGFKNKKFSHMS